jgi:hypothetical protein
MQQAQQQSTQKALVDQAGQFANTPLMDPTKNPQVGDQIQQLTGGALQPPEE